MNLSVPTKSRKIRKYVRLAFKAKGLRDRYDKKLAALEPLKGRCIQAARIADAAWMTLNAGQQAAAKKILGQPQVEASHTPAPKRSAK